MWAAGDTESTAEAENRRPVTDGGRPKWGQISVFAEALAYTEDLCARGRAGI
jgi:hypothetical protein